MPGKIFINYRRDDERAFAARVRDRLAQAFGPANVFMDVDNLMAGQRFDRELEKALAETDVFLAVIGPRWMDLYQQRQASGERDYVHEEIASGLKREITVIPVLIEGAQLPRGDLLPEDIRELVLHHKQDVSHEHFGQNIAALVEAIRFARRSGRQPVAMPKVKAGSIALLLAGGVGGMAAAYAGAYYSGVPLPWFSRVNSDTAAETRNGPDRPSTIPGLLDDLPAELPAGMRVQVGSERRPVPTPQPGQTLRDCPECPEMVVVPAGGFTMGSNDGAANEKPPRTVTIRQPFAVGKFEVTFDEWAACVAGGGCTSNRSPSDEGWGRGRRPVINVSWNDAKEYAAWLSAKTGKTYRLLSEAEWEYAARAGTSTKYSFGDTITKQQAQFSEGSFGSAGQTVEVGRFPANKFGLHDMHGNVWEWVEDAWHPNYNGAPTDGSVWQVGDRSSRVRRGGSWFSDPVSLRSSNRYGLQPDARNDLVGFRLARTL